MKKADSTASSGIGKKKIKGKKNAYAKHMPQKKPKLVSKKKCGDVFVHCNESKDKSTPVCSFTPTLFSGFILEFDLESEGNRTIFINQVMGDYPTVFSVGAGFNPDTATITLKVITKDNTTKTYVLNSGTVIALEEENLDRLELCNTSSDLVRFTVELNVNYLICKPFEGTSHS
ncbi:hypothetical protein IC620_01620 [Hazenella sp. IB182357]|uniref:Uncharacterized protein n=1 Tax=Polycladospora coralii TaxID=2771432 RepID=A0A926RW31_9BACL|nr:hypothetical protein [Polycladospora coralii]MBD1371056.1 hypothetical protein [Polycladospora coralii]MBS7529995.1 hypothetical protein [Polycladospora coralii]